MGRGVVRGSDFELVQWHLVPILSADPMGLEGLLRIVCFLRASAGVAERLAHQAPGGDGDDGLVEVLDLDRVQGDIHHIAVGPGLGHLDPVADVEHVVAGQLHAGDERQQGVLVHQQQHRRHGTQTRQQQQRRAVDQGGDDDDGGEDPQHHLGQLHVALDRAGAGMFGAGVDVQQRVEQARQRAGHKQQGDGQGEVAEKMLGGGREFRHQLQAELHHQRWGGLGQAVQHLVVAQVVQPSERRLPAQQAAGVQDQEARQAADQQRDEQQHGQAEGGVQQRVLVEGAPEVEGIAPESLEVHKRRKWSVLRYETALERGSAQSCQKKFGSGGGKRYPMQLEFFALARGYPRVFPIRPARTPAQSRGRAEICRADPGAGSGHSPGPARA